LPILAELGLRHDHLRLGLGYYRTSPSKNLAKTTSGGKYFTDWMSYTAELNQQLIAVQMTLHGLKILSSKLRYYRRLKDLFLGPEFTNVNELKQGTGVQEPA